MAERDELRLRPNWLAEWSGPVSLIEPSIGSTAGIPDAHLVDDLFQPGWVEFKALDLSGKWKLRPPQKAWMRTHLPFTHRIAIVLLSNEGFWTLPVREIVEARLQPSYLPPSSPLVPWEGIGRASLPSLLEKAYALNA